MRRLARKIAHANMKRQGLEKVNRNNGKGGSYFSQNWHDYVEYRRAKA